MCASEKKKEKKCSYLLQPKQKGCQSIYTVIYNAGRSAEGSVWEAEGMKVKYLADQSKCSI